MARRTRLLQLFVAGCLFVNASVTRAVPPAWPQFRGPNGGGVSAEEKPLPVEFGPEKNCLWKTPLSSGHSPPCISGDKIFVTGYDAEREVLEAICLDRLTGAILWRSAAPADKIERAHELGSPAASSTAADAERVYVYFGSYGLLCYDGKTGTLHFRERLGAEGSYYASPVAGDGKIYVSSMNGRVVVLEAADELRVVARNDLGERVMATPAIADGTLYIRTAAHLYAFRK